jgi:hypothetical protein
VKNDFFGSDLSSAKLISDVLTFLSSIHSDELQNLCSSIRRHLLYEMNVEMSESNQLLSDLNRIVSGPIEKNFRPQTQNVGAPINLAVFGNTIASSSIPLMTSRNKAPANSNEPVYFRYTPKQVAEMITLIDITFLRAIELHEFVGAKWSKDKKAAPNVHRVAARNTYMVSNYFQFLFSFYF